MANRAYYRQKNKQKNNKKKTLISTLKNFLFSLFNYLSLQKKKFIPDEAISAITRDRHAPLAMTHQLTVIRKIDKASSITWSSAIHCALLSLLLRGGTPPWQSVFEHKRRIPKTNSSKLKHSLSVIARKGFALTWQSVLQPIYHKQQRNKLTASILTFVFIFNTLIGIFSPVNVFNFNNPKQEVNAAWFNENGTWLYRKSITIDHTKVSGDLTNFPMLVSLTDVALKDTTNGGKVTNSNGYDISFTSENGSTKLDHEIETYTNTTGELKAWVKIPALSGSVDTTIYIYYGNSNITTTQENITGVWDDGGANNFKMVQHMNQDPSGTAPQMIDSTQYNNDGTSGGTMTSGDLVSGQVGNGIDFDGTDDYLSVGYSNIASAYIGTRTVEAWVNARSVGMPAYSQVAGQSGWHRDLRIATTNVFQTSQWFSDGSMISSSSSAITLNKWYHVIGIWDKENLQTRLYLNGVLVDSDIAMNDIAYNTTPIYIGGISANWLFSGSIDEVRISNTARSADWISTEYNNQSNPTEFYTLGIEEVSSQTPLSTFTYRKAITIDHTKVSADLTNFPVLISLPTDSSLSNNAQADADDILFTSQDITWNTGTINNKLAHEIESYTSSTGELQTWVNIPNLSSTEDTTIYMYYGNATVTSQQNKTAVWDNNTKMVQHMNENPSGSAPQMIDSTQYNNDGTSGGTMTSGDLVTGRIDGATDFDGVNDYINAGNDASLDITDEITISAWMNPTELKESYIVGKFNGDTVTSAYNFLISSNNIYLRLGDGSVRHQWYLPHSFVVNNWYYLSATYDGDRLKIYKNGDFLGQSGSDVFSIATNTLPVQIGMRPISSYPFPGSIDEVRISNTARSADWISTEYNNQSEPTEFYALGIEEVSSQTPLSTFTYRKAITIDHTKVSANLTNFPVLINLPTDTSLSSYAQSDADDILFTSQDIIWNTGTINNKLAHEIEKYTTATGELQAWVNIPNLSSTEDTIIYILWQRHNNFSTKQNCCMG